MINIEALLKIVEQDEQFGESVERIRDVMREGVLKGTFPYRIDQIKGHKEDSPITTHSLRKFFEDDDEVIPVHKLVAWRYNMEIGAHLSDREPFTPIFNAVYPDLNRSEFHIPTHLFFRRLDSTISHYMSRSFGAIKRAANPGSLVIGDLRVSRNQLKSFPDVGDITAEFIEESFKGGKRLSVIE